MTTIANRSMKPGGSKSVFTRYFKCRTLFIMLIPGLIYYIIFHYGPMYGVQIAFRNFNIRKGIWGSPWVGLKYFRELFALRSFKEVFTNTLTISSLKLIFGFPAPIIFALLLSELRATKFKKTVQTISYLPHFLSWIVLGGIFTPLLSPTTGPVNEILVAIGLKPIYFLADPAFFRSTLVATSIWKGVGWGSVIYLAAITGVDSELFEAASLDGANRFQRIIHVTLPAIAPTITIMLIFAVGGIVGDDFDQIFNLYNSSVYRVGDVLGTYVYRKGLEGLQYSFAAAVGLFVNIISIILVLMSNKVAAKFGEYGIW